MKRALMPLVAVALALAIFWTARGFFGPSLDLDAVSALDWPSRIEARSEGGTEFDGVQIDHIERRAPLILRRAGGYAVADIADLRLARPVRDGDPEGPCGAVLISSTRPPIELRGTAAGTLGSGKRRVSVSERRGVTSIRWAELEIRVQDGVLRVAGREIPLGTGRRLFVFDADGRPVDLLRR